MLNLRIKAIQLRNNIFGPKVTDEEIVLLRTRADLEGWTDWLELVEATKSTRKRRWLLRYIIDGRILVYVHEIDGDDPYEDEDPWQQDL